MTAAEIKRVEARHTDTHKYNHTRATPGGNCWTCKQQSKARRSQLNFDSTRQPVAARQINLFKSPLFTIVSDCAASALPTLSHCQGSGASNSRQPEVFINKSIQRKWADAAWQRHPSPAYRLPTVRNYIES